jgi:hypothetical protein
LKQFSTSSTATCLKTEVWPPGSLDINPFDYLKCGVSRGGINRSSHKNKQSVITTIMEVFSNIPGEDLKRACSRFQSRLEEVVAAKCDFTLNVKFKYK